MLRGLIRLYFAHLKGAHHKLLNYYKKRSKTQHRKFSMVFKATITIEWNDWGQPSCSMVFDGCSSSVKQCDAMDHRSSLLWIVDGKSWINDQGSAIEEFLNLDKTWILLFFFSAFLVTRQISKNVTNAGSQLTF